MNDLVVEAFKAMKSPVSEDTLVIYLIAKFPGHQSQIPKVVSAALEDGLRLCKLRCERDERNELKYMMCDDPNSPEDLLTGNETTQRSKAGERISNVKWAPSVESVKQTKDFKSSRALHPNKLKKLGELGEHPF